MGSVTDFDAVVVEDPKGLLGKLKGGTDSGRKEREEREEEEDQAAVHGREKQEHQEKQVDDPETNNEKTSPPPPSDPEKTQAKPQAEGTENAKPANLTINDASEKRQSN